MKRRNARSPTDQVNSGLSDEGGRPGAKNVPVREFDGLIMRFQTPIEDDSDVMESTWYHGLVTYVNHRNGCFSAQFEDATREHGIKFDHEDVVWLKSKCANHRRFKFDCARCEAANADVVAAATGKPLGSAGDSATRDSPGSASAAGTHPPDIHSNRVAQARPPGTANVARAQPDTRTPSAAREWPHGDPESNSEWDCEPGEPTLEPERPGTRSVLLSDLPEGPCAKFRFLASGITFEVQVPYATAGKHIVKDMVMLMSIARAMDPKLRQVLGICDKADLRRRVDETFLRWAWGGADQRFKNVLRNFFATTTDRIPTKNNRSKYKKGVKSECLGKAGVRVPQKTLEQWGRHMGTFAQQLMPCHISDISTKVAHEAVALARTKQRRASGHDIKKVRKPHLTLSEQYVGWSDGVCYACAVRVGWGSTASSRGNHEIARDCT